MFENAFRPPVLKVETFEICPVFERINISNMGELPTAFINTLITDAFDVNLQGIHTKNLVVQ